MEKLSKSTKQKELKESKRNQKSQKSNKLSYNLYYFSEKILEAKYSSTPELYEQMILNNLILRKKNHLLAYLNEISITSNIIKESIKRFYLYEESKERIPKYVSYYQNYLKYFCRPIFGDYVINKKMAKHMEKNAQVFYNENYADEDEDTEKNEKFSFKIFSKTVKEELDKEENNNIKED